MQPTKTVDPAVSEAARALAHRSWAATPDRAARTAPAQAARKLKAAQARAARQDKTPGGDDAA